MNNKCWKYKLSKMISRKPYNIPMCCVGCKYAKNNACVRRKKK